MHQRDECSVGKESEPNLHFIVGMYTIHIDLWSCMFYLTLRRHPPIFFKEILARPLWHPSWCADHASPRLPQIEILWRVMPKSTAGTDAWTAPRFCTTIPWRTAPSVTWPRIVAATSTRRLTNAWKVGLLIYLLFTLTHLFLQVDALVIHEYGIWILLVTRISQY